MITHVSERPTVLVACREHSLTVNVQHNAEGGHPGADRLKPRTHPMVRPTVRLAAVAALFWLGSQWEDPVQAGVALMTPSGLAPGDQFRFVFVTDGSTTATSTDIGTYDAFVESQAGGCDLRRRDGQLACHRIDVDSQRV